MADDSDLFRGSLDARFLIGERLKHINQAGIGLAELHHLRWPQPSTQPAYPFQPVVSSM